MKRFKALCALVMVAVLFAAFAVPAVAVDLKDLTIENIPQEKLDTTVYLAASIRGLHNPFDPYIDTVRAGMIMFADYLESIGQKYKMELQVSIGSSDKEVDDMRQLVASASGNALAYSDTNEDAIAFALTEAMAEGGGYIGTAWNKPDDVNPANSTPNWVIHTSPDNVQSGYLVAKELFESMGGSGRVFVCEGTLDNTAAINRRIGLEQALAEYPGIVTEGTWDTGKWNTQKAMILVKTWLTAYPDVGGVWCANDNMALGAIQALDKAGLKGKVGVVGVDAIPEIVEAVRDGYAIATASPNGYLQGGYTLAVCYAAWVGLIDVAELPAEYREFATLSLLVTKENAEEVLNSAPVFDFSKPFFCKAD